ncbi:MAG: GGDEF domain-containing protein [Tardiphaga sp.]
MSQSRSVSTLPATQADDAARRAARRRPAHIAQVLSYTLDAAILWLYSLIGVTSSAICIAYLGAGLATTGTALWMSERHLSDRAKDQYLTLPLCVASTTVQLVALTLAPEVGFYFIALLFVILGFGALRMSARETAMVWTYATVGMAALFLLTNIPIAMPMDGVGERALVLACFVTALGRCASTGLYGSSMREMLYRRSNDLKRANARIEELAQLDELTGALNRRYIMKCLNDEIARIQRGAPECCVAIIDLDHFKHINDRFGHPIGDEVLRTFAISIFANIRTTDRLGRQGGEEFLLVLPGTAVDQAMRTLDRLRGQISELNWPAIAPDLTLSISAGVSPIRASDSAEDVLARADRALYSAKDGGRDRVNVAA